MLTAPSADYTVQEALLRGATPVVRATFLPYPWPNGVDGDGSFIHCSFVAPGRIEADYEGFSGGEWISEVVTANLQIAFSPAVLTWDWNYPGFDVLLYYRAAADVTDLAAAAWTLVNQGDTLDILPYYQFRATMEGYRCWTSNSGSVDDGFLAYATTDPDDPLASYAAPTHVANDTDCYIENLVLLGEFTVVRDIEKAGTITQEAPRDFSDLVAGSHDGLTLNNRQGSGLVTVLGPGEIDYTWTPAPLFSPGKPSFFMSQNPAWYGDGTPDNSLKLRIDHCFDMGGFLKAPFFKGPLFQRQYTDPLTLFLGAVDKYGPVNRSVDQDGKQSENTVQVRAQDFILSCLQRPLCLPADDGTPQPLTMGEFICKAEAVSGWSPVPALKSAYFAKANYNELDHVVALGGGAFSLIAPGIAGTRAFRASTTGANQSAYGSLVLPFSGEMFVTGTMRFTAVPLTIANLNMTFMEIIDSSGAADFALSVDSNGAIYGSLGLQSQFNILGYVGAPLFFGIWVSPANPGYAYFWIGGDNVVTYTANLIGDKPIEFRFGVDTGAVAETWDIDFEAIEVRPKYYKDAFRVTGAPFNAIGPVYVDGIAQPDSKSVGAYTQTLSRFPEWGMVQFTSTDPDFSPSGEVTFRVIENAGGRHALYGIETILGLVGLTDYIDATALAAAYVACPDDIIQMRFEAQKSERFGLKDFASLGIPAGDCLKEILSRMMYWLFIDAGVIKIVPYTGSSPTSPAMAFDASNMHEASQSFMLGGEDISAYVTAIYGGYDKNPSLFYVAGNPTAGAQGAGLDYSWGNSPVVCESVTIVKAKTDLLYKFLSAREKVDPLRTKRLQAARLELMTDTVSVSDILLNDSAQNYVIDRKEIVLDPPREVVLSPLRFLGDN